MYVETRGHDLTEEMVDVASHILCALLFGICYVGENVNHIPMLNVILELRPILKKFLF